MHWKSSTTCSLVSADGACIRRICGHGLIWRVVVGEGGEGCVACPLFTRIEDSKLHLVFHRSLDSCDELYIGGGLLGLCPSS